MSWRWREGACRAGGGGGVGEDGEQRGELKSWKLELELAKELHGTNVRDRTKVRISDA